MKKLTLSFEVLAAIVAVTILQASAGTAGAVSPPVLTPPTSGTCYVSVTITAPTGAFLCYWFYGSPCCKCAGASVTVSFPPTRSGTTLYAVAIQSGRRWSPAHGTYYCR